MGRTGIFGGSFNPIHLGHIHLAETVIEKLQLDRLVLMPANIPPHKRCDDYADSSDRLEMCRIAAEGIEKIEVSDWEIKENNVSYTYNTIIHFHKLYPEDTLYLLTGSDMLLYFDKWYRYKDILAEAVLVAVSREENDMDELKKKKAELEKFGRVILIDAEPIVISSTEIRKNVNKSACYLNEKVVQYINEKKIYNASSK